MPKKYAILVIDMLNDFIKGSLKSERFRRIIPYIKELLRVAREEKIPIIYVNDAHLEKIDLEFKIWPPHAVKGTWGAEVIEELAPQKGDYIIEKRRYSGFYNTNLDDTLRELKVDTLILTGICTDICVQHTAADAFYRGYKIIIPMECVESLSEKDNKKGLETMKRLYDAKVMPLKQVLSIITK